MTLRLPTALLLALAALALAACGGDDEDGGAEPEAGAPPGAAAALEHIHGLGADPRDGTLFVATHHGLFTAPPGSPRLDRVGDSERDLMGFSVVDPGRFIGSGHPGPTESDLPPNLGLIESRDGGETWESVSLLGEADFHVLRSAGDRVYGFDGTQGRLMVSDDGGREWAERRPPAPMFDLAIDPDDPDRVVAATERGLFASENAGDDWRRLRDDLTGLLARPAGERLYLAGAGGQVLRSRDGGRDWRPVGTLPDEPVAFAASGRSLYAAIGDGTVYQSGDGGSTWRVRAAP